MTIEEQLSAVGTQWRASLDPDPSLDELFAGASTTRRRRWIPALSAAALIIAVCAAVAVAGSRHGGSPVANGPTVPQHPGQCSDEFSADLTPTPARVPAGADSTAEIRLRYDGAEVCSATMDLTAVDLVRSGAPDIEVFNTVGQTKLVGPPATIRPGDEFDTTLTWSSYCDTAVVTGFRFRLGSREVGVVPLGALSTPRCASAGNRLAVTALLDTADAGILHVGIRYSGGPAPGDNQALRAGTVIVSVGPDPYRTVVVNEGERTTVVVAAVEGAIRYRVTGTSGDAACAPQTITVAAGAESEVTVACSVR